MIFLVPLVRIMLEKIIFGKIRDLSLLLTDEGRQERQARSIVKKSESETSKVMRYFHTDRHLLDLTPREEGLVEHFLVWWLARENFQVQLAMNSGVRRKMEFHMNDRLEWLIKDRGLGKEPYFAALIGEPCEKLAELWATNYQNILVIDREIKLTGDPDFKSDRLVEIDVIVKQTRTASATLVEEIRQYERMFYSVQSQLTFKS